MGIYNSIAAIGAVATLDDPVRKSLYDAVRHAGRPLTREQAAELTGVSRGLAAFHLDKLVAAGLLRNGAPNAGQPRRVGRSPKTYEPAPDTVSVSLPVRSHLELAEILLAAIAEHPDQTTVEAVADVAQARGRAAGEISQTGADLTPGQQLDAVAAVLEDRGYEPYEVEPGRLRMRNCPFHPVACQSPDIVCDLNQHLCRGIVEGMSAGAVEVAAVPPSCDGGCCIEMRLHAAAPADVQPA